MLALTGCRSDEIVNLKWQEIDEAGNCLRLKDSKEGASVRPVGQPAFGILAKIEKNKGCPFVLASVRGENAFGAMPGAWRRIAKRADAVIMQEHVTRAGNHITLQRPIRAGDNIRHRGEDIEPLEPLLQAGTRLDARHIALMAAQGVRQVSVVRKLCVAVLSTGD